MFTLYISEHHENNKTYRKTEPKNSNTPTYEKHTNGLEVNVKMLKYLRNKSLESLQSNIESIPVSSAFLGGIMGSLIIVLGVFGNGLLIMVVWKYPPLRRASNLFVVSMAACDLFHSLLVGVHVMLLLFPLQNCYVILFIV